MARLLLTYLKKLDNSYRANNYQKLFEEIVLEFEQSSSSLNEKIAEMKLQLFRGIDTIRKNFSALEELYEKKAKALKRSKIRECIQTISIPLCITSPKIKRALNAKLGMGLSKNKPNDKTSTSGRNASLNSSTVTAPEEKIEMGPQDTCLHRNLPLVKELSENLFFFVGLDASKTSKKSDASQRSRGKTTDVQEDLISDKLCHCASISQ